MSSNIFVYPLEGGLYINLTNRCSNDCVFCIREGDTMSGFDLWLSREPTTAEVTTQMDKYPQYDSVVFCGYGEPTYRLTQLLEVAAEAKSRGKTVRLNTNGLGNAINGRDITAELKGCVDTVSISLNAPDKAGYDEVSRPKIENSFEEMLNFVKLCVSRGIDVVLSAVDIIGAQKAQECAALAQSLGAKFRLREYIEPEKTENKRK